MDLSIIMLENCSQEVFFSYTNLLPAKQRSCRVAALAGRVCVCVYLLHRSAVFWVRRSTSLLFSS